MPYLLLGVALLAGLVLLAHWFVNADPKRLAGTIRLAAITAGLAIALFILFRGGLGLVMSSAALVVPLIARWQRIRAFWPSGSKSPQTSGLETAYLRVALDHETGRVEGDVTQGRHAGRRLESLDLEELIGLLSEVATADPASAQVLEAYLDRLHPDWRERAQDEKGTAGYAGSAAMTREEAWRVLGLEPGAEEVQIREAHRRLMMANHPDRGGSTYLAAQINRAKDVLLGG